MFILTGLVGGMSSIYSAFWSYFSNASFFQQEKYFQTRQWRLVYAAGLILGAFIWLLGFSGSSASRFLIVDAQSVKNTDTAENKGYDAGKKFQE